MENLLKNVNFELLGYLSGLLGLEISFFLRLNTCIQVEYFIDIVERFSRQIWVLILSLC